MRPPAFAAETRDVWRFLVGIAAIGAAGIALCMACALSGCQKKSADEAALGAEISKEDVQKALDEPLKSVDRSSLKPGAFVHWSENEAIAGFPAISTEDVLQTVSDRDETQSPDYVVFRLLERKQIRVGAKIKTVETEREASAVRPGHAGASASAAGDIGDRPNQELGEPLSDGSAKMPALGDSEAPPRTTFHNLELKTERVAPPELVKAKADCGGLKGCSMEVRQIEYDVAVWKGDPPAPQKTHFKIRLSADVPPMASLLDRCATRLVAKADSQILLTHCSPILDFGQ